MKNKINSITKMGMLLGLTAIAVCMAPGQSSASGKPSHGGGSGGGSFYATVSTLSQLIADINYANQAGGDITINLAPGTTFDLTSANNTTDGGNGLPVIGGTKAVALTIIGNGDTIERIAVIGRYYTVKNPFRLFDVAPGASLTLDEVTLKGGASGPGGAILNQGTLRIIDGSILSGNSGSSGGGIHNAAGTVTVSDSTLSGNGAGGDGGGICNAGGTVTISNSTLSGSGALGDGGGIYNAGGTVAVSNGTLDGNGARFGGGIYNDGGTITIEDSTVDDNSANHYDYPWYGGYGGGIYNSAGTVVIDHGTLTGNTADPGLEDSFFVGGGIFNDSQGTVTVENDSHITGNLYDDVDNGGVLQLDSTSTIGSLDGNPATPF
jgi:hypothetical protein